jgi:hypothetical protein
VLKTLPFFLRYRTVMMADLWLSARLGYSVHGALRPAPSRLGALFVRKHVKYRQ